MAPNAQGQWQAELTPAYVFPVLDQSGKIVRWERRVYDDVVRIAAAPAPL